MNTTKTPTSNLNGSQNSIVKNFVVRYPSGVTKRMSLSYETLMRLKRLGLLYGVIQNKFTDEIILVLR